jgi:hypothetical protein
MRENRPSGSEGGVALTTPSLPLSKIFGARNLAGVAGYARRCKNTHT